MSDITNHNEERAHRGAAALEGYLNEYEDGAENDTVSNLGDLIADVLHYAKAEGFDALAILDTATAHFNEES